MLISRIWIVTSEIFWFRCGVFIVNLEHILYLVLEFLLLPLNMQLQAGEQYLSLILIWV